MNRYGRHGTRAWLRRYLRRREQLREAPTALVAAKPFIPVVVFNITVPAGVGKVIIIVQDEQGEHVVTTEIGTNGQNPPLPEGRFVSEYEKNEGVQMIADRAKTLARITLQDMQSHYGGAPIYLCESDIDQYVPSLVKTEIRSPKFAKDRDYNNKELEPIFARVFKQTLRENKDYPCNFQSEDDWQMSGIVKEDKEIHHIHITDPCHYHDPGIIHAIKKYGINLEEAYTNAEHVEWIEQWSKKYAAFYGDPRKEVHQVDLTIFLERD